MRVESREFLKRGLSVPMEEMSRLGFNGSQAIDKDRTSVMTCTVFLSS